MPADSNVEEKKKARSRPGRVRAFWGRVTEGLALQQLWGQFFSEAEASYHLYSEDVDWKEIGQRRGRVRRVLRSIRAVFLAMLMKRSPARRVLLLAGIVLLVLNVHNGWGVLGMAILLLLSCIQNAPLESVSETLKRVMGDVHAFACCTREHDDITCLLLHMEL